jgi:hypothetical protein
MLNGLKWPNNILPYFSSTLRPEAVPCHSSSSSARAAMLLFQKSPVPVMNPAVKAENRWNMAIIRPEASAQTAGH